MYYHWPGHIFFLILLILKEKIIHLIALKGFWGLLAEFILETRFSEIFLFSRYESIYTVIKLLWFEEFYIIFRTLLDDPPLVLLSCEPFNAPLALFIASLAPSLCALFRQYLSKIVPSFLPSFVDQSFLNFAQAPRWLHCRLTSKITLRQSWRPSSVSLRGRNLSHASDGRSSLAQGTRETLFRRPRYPTRQ